jgi:2-hydroxy-3-oxopropionate reductase
LHRERFFIVLTLLVSILFCCDCSHNQKEASPEINAPAVVERPATPVTFTFLVTSDEHGWLTGALHKGRQKGGTAAMLAMWKLNEGLAPDAPVLPVSGGDIGARNATLAIMVGGPVEAVEKVMPVFMAMGKTVTHVGEAGAGQVAKAANQIMVAAQMVAMGELLVFAQKAGVDPQKVVEAIKGGAAQCWTLDVKPPRLFAGNRTPGFKASMQAKDLNIILETAREYGVPLPSAAVDAQLYNAMLQNDMGGLDNSAVIGIIEELAGETLTTSSS